MPFIFTRFFLHSCTSEKNIFCRKFRENVLGKKNILEMIWTHCGSPCHYHMHRRQLKASFIGHPVLITSCKSWGKYSHIFHVKMALPQWPFLHVKPIFLAVISRTFFSRRWMTPRVLPPLHNISPTHFHEKNENFQSSN